MADEEARVRELSDEEACELVSTLLDLDRWVGGIDYYRFRPDAPVAAWMRTSLDGLMVRSDALEGWTLGRVWDRVEWSALATAHPQELVVQDPAIMWPKRGQHQPVTWADLTTLDIQLRRTTEPVLDVDLGVLGFAPSGVVELLMFPISFHLPEAVTATELAEASTLLGKPTNATWRQPGEQHDWMLCDLKRVTTEG